MKTLLLLDQGESGQYARLTAAVVSQAVSEIRDHPRRPARRSRPAGVGAGLGAGTVVAVIGS